MISQRQMKEWIPQALEDFKAVMPPIDVPFPEIHILSRTTQEAKREEIVDRLHSPLINQGEPALMETLHGDAGDAILVYQKYFREDPYDPDNSRIAFQHYLRHELGHFYALYTECTGADLFRYMDQKPREGTESIRQTAYWIWTEFIAEAIACHTDPDDIDYVFTPDSLYSIRRELYATMLDIFYRDDQFIDEYALGFYFAKKLKNKKTALLLDTLFNRDKRRFQNYIHYDDPLPVDITCRSDIDPDFLPLMDEMEGLLKEQLMKDHFWEIDSDLITELGLIKSELTIVKNTNSSASAFGDRIRKMLSAGC